LLPSRDTPAMTALDTSKTREFVSAMWRDACVPSLVEFVRIPNKSPAFDPQWREHGHMDRAVDLVASWCRGQAPAGAGWTVTVERLEGRTPLVVVEVPATDGGAQDPVLLYGHLDKQPEMTGWSPGLGPWTPVLKDGRLYGRGGADDGYAAFACVTALRALAEQRVPHRRAIVLIEACEESGSGDLPHYVEHLAARIGSPSLVVCLDSGCGDYDHWWVTTSLRGVVVGTLVVEVLTEGVHSGDAGGVVADSFRIVRALLDRVEDAKTGRVLLREAHVEIPAERAEQARRTAAVLGRSPLTKYPLAEGMRPMTDDPPEAILSRTWRPALTVTGADGLPAVRDAGNVHRPLTSVKMSLRLPPTCAAEPVVAAMRAALERDPPYGAKVRVLSGHGATGWNAPGDEAWLSRSLAAASHEFFGRDVMHMGEGGTIPFMAMLGKRFPAAQFCVTGALGPGSNAHGPNEFLDLATAERVTCCVARLLADHRAR
jgi:acetylornithine deacetylase/succinyl-diaminopimelate desuccinylase-like protein